MPAVSLEAFGCVFGEGEFGEAFDGHVIVVVEIDELAELQMTRKRCSFRRNAFHQIAVRDDGVNIMVNDRETIFIKLRRQMRRAHRHADAVSETLTERASRDLNTGRQSVLRMAGRL